MKKSFVCFFYFVFLCLCGMSIAGCHRCTADVTHSVGTCVRDTIAGVPCVVYMPESYAKRARQGERFPCLYLQHGMFGSEDDWTQQGHLLEHMDSLLQAGAVHEMIVVMPDNFLGSVPPAERAALMAAADVTPLGEAFSTERGAAHWRKLTREQEQSYEMSGYWEEHFPAFIHAVEQRYAVLSTPADRAIAGLSMGGFHTMHVSHYLPESFGYVALFSAVILPRTAPDLQGIQPDGNDGYRTAGFAKPLTYGTEVYDTWMTQVQQQAAMQPLYWMAIGREDFLYTQLQDYRKWLETNSIAYTYYETDGGHTWQNWQDYLCRFLPLCFRK